MPNHESGRKCSLDRLAVVSPHVDEVNAALARTLYERYDEVTIDPDDMLHKAQHVVSSHPDQIVWEQPAG